MCISLGRKTWSSKYRAWTQIHVFLYHSGVLGHLFEAGVKVQDMDNNDTLLETNDWIYSILITTGQWQSKPHPNKRKQILNVHRDVVMKL